MQLNTLWRERINFGVATALAGTAIYLVLFVYQEEKDIRTTAMVSATPEKLTANVLDVFRTGFLPDGNFETFRRVQLNGTIVTCYSITNPDKNKTLFHTCTFEPSSDPTANKPLYANNHIRPEAKQQKSKSNTSNKPKGKE